MSPATDHPSSGKPEWEGGRRAAEQPPISSKEAEEQKLALEKWAQAEATRMENARVLQAEEDLRLARLAELGAKTIIHGDGVMGRTHQPGEGRNRKDG
jgi:Ser/Thr protein kinase RdoA (MazF antagonist)